MLFALAVCVAPMTAAAQAPTCATGVVTTRVGPVCGTVEPTGSGKQARPFAASLMRSSTAGEKRWTPPVPKARWTQTFAAVRYGAICPQNSAGPSRRNRLGAYRPRDHGASPQELERARATRAANAPAPPQPPAENEDCLTLNIWTPAGCRPNAALPVMVFIHGGIVRGGFGRGSDV